MGSIVNAAVGPGASDYRERALRAAGIDPASAEAKGYEVHQSLHTGAYYNGVNDATRLGLLNGGSSGVSVALSTIKASLITRGQFP